LSLADDESVEEEVVEEAPFQSVFALAFVALAAPALVPVCSVLVLK
jgi:hypothetical protein